MKCVRVRLPADGMCAAVRPGNLGKPRWQLRSKVTMNYLAACRGTMSLLALFDR
jgi:hypothetical protein